MDQATCLADGCQGTPFARRLCANCYARAWRAGSFPEEAAISRHRVSDVDPETRDGVCNICGPVRAYWRSDRNYWQCRTVRARHRKPPTREQIRHDGYRRKYGISLKQYNAMYAAVEGRCGICQQELPLLHVDHDHGTGVVRGLLCQPCNLGLGNFKDNPHLLGRAIDYLSKVEACS